MIATKAAKVKQPDIQPAFEAGVPLDRKNPKYLEDARRQWMEKGTDSPYFKRWFGDSKVVDDQGKPLVVYHGTADKITKFDTENRGRTTAANSAKKGFFFASNKAVADEYSTFARPQKIDALKKTADAMERVARKLNTDAAWKRYELAYLKYEQAELSYASGESRSEAQHSVQAYLHLQNPLIHDFHGSPFRDETYASLLQQAKEEKKDGAIFKNTFDGNGEPGSYSNPKTDVYVVFDPTQIKSATGNRGTFEGGNADIRYSLGRRNKERADEGTEPILAGDEFGEPGKTAFYQRAKEWAASNLRGRQFRNEETGRDWYVGNKGIGHTMRTTRDTDTILSLKALPELIGGAKKVASHPDKYNRPSVKAVSEYVSPITIGGHQYEARMRVLEVTSGNHQLGILDGYDVYSHHYLKNKSPGVPTEGMESYSKPAPANAKASSGIIGTEPPEGKQNPPEAKYSLAAPRESKRDRSNSLPHSKKANGTGPILCLIQGITLLITFTWDS